MSFEPTKKETKTSTGGTIQQANAVDLVEYFEHEVEGIAGFTLDSIFNVNLFDLEERIDITIGKDGFDLDVVPLGTNYLSYDIKVKNGTTWTAIKDAGFATSGASDDLNFASLFGKTADLDDKEYRVSYKGYYSVDDSGPQSFSLQGKTKFDVFLDGVKVATGGPGGAGSFARTLEHGTHEIEIVAYYDSSKALPGLHSSSDIAIHRQVDGKAVDLLEYVAVEHEQEFDVTAEIAVSIGGVDRTQTHEFTVTALSEIHDKVVSLAKALGAEGNARIQVDVTAEASAEVADAGDYKFKSAFVGGRASLSIDGVQKAAKLGGYDVKIPLSAGEHDFKVGFEFNGGWNDFLGKEIDATWQGAATHQHAVSLLEGPSAVSDGLVDVLNDALDLLGEGLDAGSELYQLLFLGASPLKVLPTLDFSLGLDAEFGWDVELPSLGRTTTELPVSFNLIADATAEFGGTLTARIEDLTFGSPTTRSHLVELGAIDVTSNFGLPETSLSGLGIHMGLRTLPEHLIDAVFGEGSLLAKMNHALDDLVSLELKLDAAITLEDALDMAATAVGAAGVAYDPAKSLDLTSFLKGLYENPGSVEETFEELKGYVQKSEWKKAFELFIKIGGMAPDEAESPPEDEKAPKQADPSKFQMVTDKGQVFTVASDEMLGLSRDAALKGTKGKSTLSYVDDALGKVRVGVDQINKVLEATKIDEVMTNVAKLFSEGIALVPGITFKGDLGVGRTFTGYGWSGSAAATGESQVYDPTGPIKPIVMHSEVKLLSADVDLRETALDGLNSVFDNPLLQEAEANPYVEIAKIAAALAPALIEKLEEGGSAELDVDLAPIVREAVEVFDGMMKGLATGLNAVIGALGGDGHTFPNGFSLTKLVDLAVNDEAAFRTQATLELEPLRAILNAVGDRIKAFMENLIGEIDKMIAGVDALTEATADEVVGFINNIVGHVDEMFAMLAVHLKVNPPAEHHGWFDDVVAHIEGAWNDTVGSIDIGNYIAKALSEALNKVGFSSRYAAELNQYILESDLGIFGEIRAGLKTVESHNPVKELLTALKSGVGSVDLDLDGPIDSLIDALAGFIPEVLKPLHAEADLDLDLFELKAGAELDLSQVTTFRPDAVMVEYTYGKQTQTVAYGETVEFKVPKKGAAGEVTAKVIYDGAYDFQYVIRPDFSVDDIKVLAFALQGALSHGDPTKGDWSKNFDIDYAFIKSLAGDAHGDIFTVGGADGALTINTTALHLALMQHYDDAVAAPLRELLGTERGANPLGSIVFDAASGIRADAGAGGQAFSTVSATAAVDVVKSKAIIADPDGGKVKGTKKADEIRGQDGDDKVLARGGDDTVLGGGGDDVVKGSGGKDIIDGGAGDDQLFGGGGNDVIYGDQGADRLDGGGGADRLIVDAGFASAKGGGGADAIEFDGAMEGMLIDLGSGASGLADALGGTKVFGGSMYVELETRGMSWTSAVEAAADAGGALLQIDSLAENAFVASTFGPSTFAAVWIGATDIAQNGVYRDLSGRLFGVDFANWIPGEPNDAGQPEPYVAMQNGGGWNDATLRPNNTIRTIVEIDLATAELSRIAPEETVSAIASVENVVGTEFDDWIFGTGAANKLEGRGGDDLIRGEGGRDMLFGGAGDDVLAGGEGDDVLEGGAGADRFAFSGAFGTDVIRDFSGASGEGDVIDLRPVDAVVPGGLVFADLRFTQTGDDLRIEIDKDRNGVADALDLDGDAVADAVAIVLADATRGAVVEADFIL